ncbi:hypothetical protein BDV26DRAFT_261892 [Aspergillus bertholletiae]|uniref:Uncharacterized protein n=1 Tax=Aspergillus bertholletiae TaxID=1226010 RepID=A0A5N7B978_9EURO|nr:hypothetical protein BDV26DRAFT_261892 [Aspergillus bertholletiae]
MILDDTECFEAPGMNLPQALELFPERVTNKGGMAHVEQREKILTGISIEMEQADLNAEDSDNGGYSQEVEGHWPGCDRGIRSFSLIRTTRLAW